MTPVEELECIASSARLPDRKAVERAEMLCFFSAFAKRATDLVAHIKNRNAILMEQPK